MSGICFEEVESSICSLSCLAFGTNTRALKLAVTGKHLRFQPEHANHAGFSLRNCIDLSGIAHSFWDQLTAALLRNGYIVFLKTVLVDVGEIHIIELHASQLFQLFLDAAAHLKGKLQNLFQLLFGKLSIRVNKLQKSTDHLPNRYGITLV